MRIVEFATWAFAFVVAGCSAAVPENEASTGQLESESESLIIGRLCKGPANLPCAKGQYCATMTPGRCPSSTAYGVCATEPQACTDQVDPVCGCDGQTYSNKCYAAGAGVAVASAGACAPKPPTCGGIAGIPCPGFGQCIDDPSDSCDPKHGGADCGGICSCVENVACRIGYHFVSDPEVCACLPDSGCTPCPVGRICPLVCRTADTL